MPRPSNWNSPTAAIRVPAHAVGAVLALAKQLDDHIPSSFVQNPDNPSGGPYMVTLEDRHRLERYLINPPSDIPSEVWEEADRLIDEKFSHLSEQEQLYVVTRLAQEWGTPVDA